MHQRLKKNSVLRWVPAFTCGLLITAGCNTMPVTHEVPSKSPVIHSDISYVTTPEPVSTKELLPFTEVTVSPGSAPTSAPSPTPTPTPTSTPTPVPTPAGTFGEVRFSEAGYFLTDTTSIELSIFSERKKGYITYTLDGTEPTDTDTVYSEPILLTSTEDTAPNVYSIRAKAWYDDGSSSDTYVHTYFLSKSIDSRYSTIVFSINGNPAELTGGPDGILYGDNYKQRGRESERAVHIETLSPEGTLLFEQHAGVRVFGGSTRKRAVKSLKLYARKEYETGKGSFSTDIFGSTTADGTTPITKYDKLVLRNGGDDFQNAFLRDELVQRLAAASGFQGYEATVPALAYINGEYYGFYWLHESYCDKYFQNRNGKSDGEYVVLEGSDTYKSISGEEIEKNAAKEFNALYKKYSKLDLTKDENYEALCSLMDVESYIDYMSINMYIANADWPQGNYRCFRYYAAEDEEYGDGEADGRWRFLLHDSDIGFGTYQSGDDAGAIRNDILEVIGDSSHKRYSPLLAALLKREDCKQYFIDKMLGYMNVSFSYEAVCTMLDVMCSERDTELSFYFEHLEELKSAGVPDVYGRPSRTNQHIERIRSFAKQRPEYITRYLEEFFRIDLNAGNE